ncbi:MAG TPA: hypothetical protein VIV66_20055 [Pyrinomonadaceae bacterium]
MFDNHHHKLAPFSVFVNRIIGALMIAFGLIVVALLIGIAGYHWLAKLSWIDSFLEASMILGGMGPVNQLTSNGAKIFASIYALFAGVMFIGVMGVVISPIIHRGLHKIHLDEADLEKKASKTSKRKDK